MTRRHPSGATRDMLILEELKQVMPVLSDEDYERTLSGGSTDTEEEEISKVITKRCGLLRAAKLAKVKSVNRNRTNFDHTVDPAIIGCDTH